ncbi:hypothetical protein E2C01_037760 [Portunus trituberculatus]|uniref:Uncharacterized protein n=1 Tax=Portunus trituberculatus TaxID=210409 RepID=A0A5B7FEY5_PORTR|nr:hypothetical protein [Portunus trituberculatus]
MQFRYPKPSPPHPSIRPSKQSGISSKHLPTAPSLPSAQPPTRVLHSFTLLQCGEESRPWVQNQWFRRLLESVYLFVLFLFLLLFPPGHSDG